MTMPADLRDLVALEARVQIRAIRTLPADPALGFALRRLLFSDEHAEVRAAAAIRLGMFDVAGPWLLDAIGDRAPLVRDAVIRGLARTGTATAIDALADRIANDRVWWVRRAAIYALAAIAPSEIATFKLALDDPFWRVRHAAVKVLAVLGARDTDVRDEVVASPPSASLTFLRATWGPVGIEAPDRATSTTSLLPAALLDADPAVVTARLAADPHVANLALVELLCDPHLPLRSLACDRLAEAGDPAALIAALDWLDAFQIPHVADTVEMLLDGLGDRAVPIAEHALARTDRPGAGRWAIGWVVATDFEPLFEAALDRARRDRALRGGVVSLAEVDELAAWAAEDDRGALTELIAVELHARRTADDTLLALLDDAPRVRALQLDALGRAESWDALHAALGDAHHGSRAVATRHLVHARQIDGLAQLADPDPAVREAALTAETAAALVGDRDPFVARAAIERLVTAHAHAHVVPPAAIAAAVRALADRDPELRARACRLAIHDRAPATLIRLCELAADRSAGVRAGVLDAFEHGPDVANRLRALVAAPLPDLARAMAYAYLLRDLDPTAGELAHAALADTTFGAHTIALLHAVAELHGLVAPRPITVEVIDMPEVIEPIATPATVARRAFGRTGFAVAPLAISGAFDLQPSTLRLATDAGADLFFWEPAYHGLTRFLRTHAAPRVLAGSYHAEPEMIEADIDRALRQLGRETLDGFLLFWSRSAARIDPEAYEALARIKRSGKVRAIGFSTHHRGLARTAIETSPWDVVMIRHSAAHPGIETELLPVARERGTAVVTFSALCYGRMLAGDGAPTAAECYRYSLSQPGVVACISAPRRDDELIENLAALREPLLSAQRIAELRAHGVGVRAENQRFNALLRQPTRDAAAAAREMLAAELPPDHVVEDRPLPRAGTSRGARTTLGTARRARKAK